MISHELRTPLQAMTGWIALLRSGRLDAAKSAHALDVIERNTHLQAQLVADLLDVSRATSGKLHLELQPLDLRALTAAALHSVTAEAARKGVRLETEGDGSAVIVEGDAVRLEQVAVNLLSNAIKFTPAGGVVRVAINADIDGAHLSVTDTGEGFDPEFMKAMFLPFSQADSASTRAHGGLGLGLMIVRHLVDAHGGRVRAETAGKGHGAIFCVDLPLSGHRLPAAADSTGTPTVFRAQDVAGGILAGLRALVVDDHADSREFVRTVLQGGGARVQEAGSAREALALLTASAFDVVISDLGMPRVDGYALLRSLRQSDAASRDVPVVALSAFAGADDRERALAAGFCAYAAKPIDAQRLIDVVAHAARRAA